MEDPGVDPGKEGLQIVPEPRLIPHSFKLLDPFSILLEWGFQFARSSVIPIVPNNADVVLQSIRFGYLVVASRGIEPL